MGTWGSQPFQTDTALDFTARVIDFTAVPVLAFDAGARQPVHYHKAIAAVAILNRIMRDVPSTPWVNGKPFDGRPVCIALAAYTTDDPYKAELEEFSAFTTPTADAKTG